MQNIITKINDFLDNNKNQIYYALILIGLVDLLFAVFFLPQYMVTHQFRDFMVFGSPMKHYSTIEFIKIGWKWLAFADVFLFMPAIVFSMLLPHMMGMAKAAQNEEE